MRIVNDDSKLLGLDDQGNVVIAAAPKKREWNIVSTDSDGRPSLQVVKDQAEAMREIHKAGLTLVDDSPDKRRPPFTKRHVLSIGVLSVLLILVLATLLTTNWLALIGFYGTNYEQCLLLHAPQADSSSGADAATYACRRIHR